MRLLLPSWRPLSSRAGTGDDDHFHAVRQAIQVSRGQQGTPEQLRPLLRGTVAGEQDEYEIPRVATIGVGYGYLLKRNGKVEIRLESPNVGGWKQRLLLGFTLRHFSSSSGRYEKARLLHSYGRWDCRPP